MKKRWFVVILTIGLLLRVLPLSVLALSPDPTITNSDGTILDWSDLSTVSDVLDDLQEQEPPVPNLLETGSEKSLASNEATADDLNLTHDNDPAGGTGGTGSTGSTGSTGDTGGTTPPEKSPADAGSDKAADDRSAVKLAPKTLDKESGDEESGDDDLADADRDKAADACKIGDTTYSTLEEAIDKASVGDRIDLLRDIEVNNTGLTFDGRTLTISGGGRYTLTLYEIGIYASDSNITFENLTLHIYAHIHPNKNGGAANLITSTNLCLDHVDFELISDRPNEYGAGLYMECGSNLYLNNGTHAVIRNFNGYKASGIYAEQTNYDPNEGNIEINSSSLKVTGCYHAGLMIDPLDLTLTSSEVVLENNGFHGYGFGLACYDGNVALKSSSTITATGNGGNYKSFGVFAGKLDVDGSSTLNAFDNGGSGLGVGDESWIHSGAKVICEGNGKYDDSGGAGGLVVYAEHGRSTYEGDLTIESGAYIYACNNVGLAGVLNSWILNIESGATVIANGNRQLGFANSYDACATIKSGANVYANNNDIGIYNYAGAGDMSKDKSEVNKSKGTGFFLIEGGAYVTANNNGSAGIYNTVRDRSYVSTDKDGNIIYNPKYNPGNDRFTIQGSADISADGNGIYGICNDGGIFTIENGAIISTCHNGYDGIANDKYGTFTMETGANVSVCNNSRHGILNNNHGTFTMETGANVSVCNNRNAGIFNTKSGTFTMKTGANVSVCNNSDAGNLNSDAGIFNTNSGTFTVEENVDLQVEHNKNSGIVNNNYATLTLLSGRVRYNTTSIWFGGGLRNYSTATLSKDVQLYNNHAYYGGDDIESNGGTITFGPTGSGWELDGDPDCYDFIDGWYDDSYSKSKPTRWNAHAENIGDRHTVPVPYGTELTGHLSLKAAHGALSTGSLTVRKETIGELLPSDYDTAFTFELTLDDTAITTINDQWCGVPFKNGKASFTLKSGESITLSNLPAGIGYTITEAAQDDWTLLNINDAETGVVPQNDTAVVVFTNLKNSPDNPDVPIVPVDPEEPEIPEEPEGPETPETPEEPEEPEIPEETEETEAPGELPAEEPAQTDTSVSLTQPEETPAQNTTTVTLPQTGTTDWLAAVLLISGFGLLGCGWFFNRKQRAAKH